MSPSAVVGRGIRRRMEEPASEVPKARARIQIPPVTPVPVGGADIQAQVNQLRADIELALTRIGDKFQEHELVDGHLEECLNAMDGSITASAAEIKDLQTNAAETNAKVAVVQVAGNDLAAKLEDSHGRIAQAFAKFEELEVMFQHATITGVATLETRVESIEGDLKKLQDKAATMATSIVQQRVALGKAQSTEKLADNPATAGTPFDIKAVSAEYCTLEESHVLLESAVTQLAERLEDAIVTIKANPLAANGMPQQPQPVVFADTRACPGRHECHCGHVDDIGVEVMSTKDRVANVERQIQALEQRCLWPHTSQALVSAIPVPRGQTSQPRPMPQPRVDDAVMTIQVNESASGSGSSRSLW